MTRFFSLFDASDGLDTTATFILLLPFLFLMCPLIVAAQFDHAFLSLTLLGWLLLPGLTWATAEWAHRLSGCSHRRGFGSLLLWLGMSFSFAPTVSIVAWYFWLSRDYAWTAGFFFLALLVVWEAATRFRTYSRRKP